MFSCEIFENSKNAHFEEHLRTTVLESYKSIACIRKTVVLGKLVKDTINLQNTFYWKHEPYEVSLCNIHLYQNAFCYLFQASEED